MPYDKLPSATTINQTITSLQQNGIETSLVNTSEEAKTKVLSLIPPHSEVMTMSSVTLQEVGLTAAINESNSYKSIRQLLSTMDRAKDSRQMQIIGASPEYAIGSVHAVTMSGSVLIASNTGSQLPAYVYSSDHVIWVVGTQKIVPDIATGMSRIYDYVLAKESVRVQKAYGVPNSFVSKLLIFNREIKPGRVHLVFVNQILGF